MGSSESRLDTSAPTPPDQNGEFSVNIGEGLVENMTGQTGGKQEAMSQVHESRQQESTDASTSAGEMHRLQRLPAPPDMDMLQKAYDEGARDMKENLDREVERRVVEQLSLRARMQGAAAREEKANQERELIEKALKDALSDEEEDQRKLNEYTESLFNRQYQTPSNPLKCVEERAACLSCYEAANSASKVPLDCVNFVDAFVKCSNSVQKDFVSRGRPS